MYRILSDKNTKKSTQIRKLYFDGWQTQIYAKKKKKIGAKVERMMSRQTNYYCYCCCGSCLSFIIIISCFLAEILFFLISFMLEYSDEEILRSDNHFTINIITTATNFFNHFIHSWQKDITSLTSQVVWKLLEIIDVRNTVQIHCCKRTNRNKLFCVLWLAQKLLDLWVCFFFSKDFYHFWLQTNVRCQQCVVRMRRCCFALTATAAQYSISDASFYKNA